MIDLRLVGKKYGPISFEYTWKDVVLYALSIGAQAEELPFVYENVKGGLRVFPSFSVVMGMDLLIDLFKDLKVDLSRFIHGEQAIKLYRPIPPEGKTLVEGEITNIYDKVKGALIVWRKKVMTEGVILWPKPRAAFSMWAKEALAATPGQKPKHLNLQKGPSRISQSPILFPKTKPSSIASAVTSTRFTSTLILPKGVVFPVPSSTAFVLMATP